MDYNTLPRRIRDALENAGFEKNATTIARAYGGINGAIGETYVMTAGERMLLFTRPLGASDYTRLAFGLAQDVTRLGVKQEGYDLFLRMTARGESYEVKFPTYEESSLRAVVEAWNAAAAEHVAAVETAPPADDETPPVVLFLATLLFTAAADGELDGAERAYIEEKAPQYLDALDPALAYYQARSFEDLRADLRGLDAQQARCVLANVMELSMKDGLLRSAEQRLIAALAETFGLDEGAVHAIRDVLLVKNQTSVFLPPRGA